MELSDLLGKPCKDPKLQDVQNVDDMGRMVSRAPGLDMENALTPLKRDAASWWTWWKS